MVLKIEGESGVPQMGLSLPPSSGSFVGRKVEPVMAHGIYYVAVPVGLGAKVLSLAGSAANQLTFRPVVASLSAIGWIGGHALSVAGRLTEIMGKILQTDVARRVGLAGSTYTEEYFHKAMGVRVGVGDAADHAVSYIPYIGGPTVSLERGERAAERVLSSAGRGALSRIWKAAVSLLPMVGMALEYGGKATALTSRKIADLTYIGMTEPSRLNQIFQNFRDRMDSYAFDLLEAQEPPRPVFPLCAEGDFKHFIKLGKQSRKKIFQAVTSSPWLRISEEEKRTFSLALKSRGVRRTDEDKKALHILYSAYLCLSDFQKERAQLRVGEERFSQFLALSAEEQQRQLFVVLSSPMWDVPQKDRVKFQTALEQIQEALVHGEIPAEEPSLHIRELIGMYDGLPGDYLKRALTPQDFAQKLHAMDPAMACLRIMDIVRESASDLTPHEKRTLAKYRKIKQMDDWLTLDDVTQKELERILFFHFNRLPIQEQGKLYDVVPGQVWDLPLELRCEFFREGKKLLLEANVHDFDDADPSEFMNDYDNVVLFTEVLNSTLRLGKKILLTHLVTPPPEVIAFTEEQLKAEIVKVKARLESLEPLEEQGKRQLSLYLITLESTLSSREAFVPIDDFGATVSKEEVFAQRAPSPVDVSRLQDAVGSGVITSGVLYTSGQVLGVADEWAGTAVGMLLERLAQGIGVASNPMVIQLSISAMSFGLSFFGTEENIIIALKTLGLEERVRAMEAGAAQVFPLLLKLAGPLERLLLGGVSSARDWMTVLSRAMKIVGDPSSSPAQIEAVAAELRVARDGVCAAAASLGKEGVSLSQDLRAASDILLEQCAMGGTSALIRAVEGTTPSLSPAVAVAITQVRQALKTRGITEPDKGILAAVKRLWSWGMSLGGPPSAEPLAELQELASQLTLLEKAGKSSERVQSMQRLLDALPPVRYLASTSALQYGSSAYLNIMSPLLGVVQKGLELEQGVLALGGNAVIQHLKWVGLAREAGRYTTEGSEAVLRQAEVLAGKEGWQKYIGAVGAPVAKVASYALPVACSLVLGTGGFILTPILLAFLANDLLPRTGAYLAPRARPMWNYLGGLSRRGAKAVGVGVAEVTRGIGYYLQKAVNSGRYVDDKRIENFRQQLDDKDRELIFQSVRMNSKISPEDGEELERIWVQYRLGKLDASQEKALITRLLLGFEDLTAEDLLAMTPYYFSMLAPHVQERLLDIVERHRPLTVVEKVSENYLQILVDRFKGLPPEVRAEINTIPPWEYHALSEEQQRELRFLIVHSSAYRQEMGQGEDEELNPELLLEEFEREPKGEELRAFLSMYKDLDPKDFAGITPQLLLGAGEAKILHALDIIETYHARWIRVLAEKEGKDISLLRQIIQTPPPRQTSMEAQKKRLVEALASLCRQMPEYQQSYLLDMTEEEVVEMSSDPGKLEKCFSHLVAYTIEPQAKEALYKFLGIFRAQGIDAKLLCSLFNALTEEQKAEFRQGLQPQVDAIDSVRASLIATNVEIIEVTEAAEKSRIALENLVTAAELIRGKGKEGMTHQDEEKIQRYELNASAVAAKLEVFEKRIEELLAVRSKVVEALERVGVRDIPPLPLEEIERRNPQRKLEQQMLVDIVDLEAKSLETLVQQQASLEGLERVAQLVSESNSIRRKDGAEAMALMEQQNLEAREASRVGSGIARTKAVATSVLLEKRIAFVRVYLQATQERLPLIEAALQKRRDEIVASPEKR